MRRCFYAICIRVPLFTWRFGVVSINGSSNGRVPRQYELAARRRRCSMRVIPQEREGHTDAKGARNAGCCFYSACLFPTRGARIEQLTRATHGARTGHAGRGGSEPTPRTTPTSPTPRWYTTPGNSQPNWLKGRVQAQQRGRNGAGGGWCADWCVPGDEPAPGDAGAEQPQHGGYLDTATRRARDAVARPEQEAWQTGQARGEHEGSARRERTKGARVSGGKYR